MFVSNFFNSSSKSHNFDSVFLVWGWGHNTEGQLGLGDKIELQLDPTLLPLENPVDVALGQDFSLVVTQ